MRTSDSSTSPVALPRGSQRERRFRASRAPGPSESVERHRRAVKATRRAAALALALALLAAPGTSFAQDKGTVVLDGLNGPQDVVLAADGTLYVAENGTGPDVSASKPWTASGRVIAMAPDGTVRTLAKLPSLGNPRRRYDINGVGGLALDAGILYATSSRWLSGPPFARPDLAGTVVRVGPSGPVSVADTYQFELFNNPDQLTFDSHPYRLTAGPKGLLWVTDAAGNDLLKVDPASGKVSLVAVFPGLPSDIPSANRNGANEIDPVPTGLVVRDDGSALVALLSGGAFPDGASKIVEVSPAGDLSDYVTGLTAAIDLKRGPDGNLYVVQLAHFGTSDFLPATGSVLRLTPEGPKPILEHLSFPTAVTFSPAGDAYVAVGGLGPAGTGKVLRFAKLAAP